MVIWDVTLFWSAFRSQITSCTKLQNCFTQLSDFFLGSLSQTQQWIDNDPATSVCPVLSVLFDLSSRLSSWQAAVYPTLGPKPPRQTAALISLIINQYAAGSPSGEDFTQHWHLFSTNTARDAGMEGGENKDISDSRHGWSMVLCRGSIGQGVGLVGGVLKVHISNIDA